MELKGVELRDQYRSKECGRGEYKVLCKGAAILFPSHVYLTEMAAQHQVPSFELSYTTAQEYGLQDLSPQSYAALIER